MIYNGLLPATKEALTAKEKADHKGVKLEQKSIINIENAEITSLVMFHSFLDVLAVSDGQNVGIW